MINFEEAAKTIWNLTSPESKQWNKLSQEERDSLVDQLRNGSPISKDIQMIPETAYYVELDPHCSEACGIFFEEEVALKESCSLFLDCFDTLGKKLGTLHRAGITCEWKVLV